MTTKLDLHFVSQVHVSHKQALEGFDAMVNEVERLEAIVVEAVRLLKIGKAKFIPHTTNSEVDDFLSQHADSLVP